MWDRVDCRSGYSFVFLIDIFLLYYLTYRSIARPERKKKRKRKRKEKKKEGEKKARFSLSMILGSFIFAEVRNPAEIVRAPILIQSRVKDMKDRYNGGYAEYSSHS
jgi:hypothetical protein